MNNEELSFCHPVGPQELFLALLGKAGLPNCPHLFLFQSLWKLVVGCWRLRSCHLEVYRTYAGESPFQTLQVCQLRAFANFLGGGKNPAGVKRNLTLLHSRASSAFVLCTHVACKPGLVLLSFSLNAENVGCLSFPETFIWLILGTTHLFFFLLLLCMGASELNSLCYGSKTAAYIL